MRKLIHGQSIFRVLTAFLLCFTTMLALSSPVRANAKGASPLAELPVQMEALIEQYQDIMEKNPISFLSWEQADTIFPHNTTVEVIDVETGQRFFCTAHLRLLACGRRTKTATGYPDPVSTLWRYI